MNLKLGNWTIELYIAHNKFGRKLANGLLEVAPIHGGMNKIALIKALRAQQQDMTLKDAKEAVEEMFDFSTEYPKVR